MIYQTIQVVPVDVIKPELDRLYQRIEEFEAKLLKSSSEEVSVNEFLTAKQVIDEFPFSLSSLHRLNKRGELKPSGRIGKKARIYLRQDVEDYLKRQREE